MKFRNTILPVLAIGLLIFSACEKSSICIKGNNKTATKTIEMNAFEGVELDGSFNVEIHQGTEYLVEATGDENIIDLLQTDIKNGICMLNLKRGCYKNYKLTVYVTLPSLENVVLAGSGNIIVNDFTNQTELKTALSGSGNITLYDFENASTMFFSIAGSGNIDCRRDIRNVKNLEIEIEGSGNYNGYQIFANNAVAKIGGSGNIKLTTIDNLEAIIDGSGTIRYRGNPTVYQKITGSGSIIKAD